MVPIPDLTAVAHVVALAEEALDAARVCAAFAPSPALDVRDAVQAVLVGGSYLPSQQALRLRSSTWKSLGSLPCSRDGVGH